MRSGFFVVDFDKVEGCYWGLALGDAIGMPVEFNQIDVIRERYGPNGIQAPKSWALWTDDTEMTFAVTKALMTLGPAAMYGEVSDDKIGQVFAKEFIKWLDNPGHAPGVTCKTSVYFLTKNGPEQWKQAGKNDSKGCGSVMRAAPVGIWFADALQDLELLNSPRQNPKLERFARVSQIQSEMTHGHKAATAAALAGAYSVILALRGIPPVEMVEPIRVICSEIHPDFIEALGRLEKAVAGRESGIIASDVEALHSIGLGWVGDEAFAMALYAAIRHPDDFESCLRVAANHSGDSDSVACIAGSIIGALHGTRVIPQDWIDRLAEKKRMAELITQLRSFL